MSKKSEDTQKAASVTVDVRALAKLARIDATDAELEKLQTEIPGILAFVEQVQKAASDVSRVDPSHRNITRPDADPHESGTYTEDLLQAAPAREGDRIAVKQVLTRKK